jgi:hypothetical protein
LPDAFEAKVDGLYQNDFDWRVDMSIQGRIPSPP